MMDIDQTLKWHTAYGTISLDDYARYRLYNFLYHLGIKSAVNGFSGVTWTSASFKSIQVAMNEMANDMSLKLYGGGY